MLTTRASIFSRACTQNAVEFIESMTKPRVVTEAMIRGIVIHELVLLGKLTDRIVSIPYADYKTAKARELRDEALKQDKVPVIKSKLEEYQDQDFRELRDYFKGMTCEQKGAFVYANKVIVTTTTDAYNDIKVTDLKITESGSFSNLDKVAFQRGYIEQIFLYMSERRAKQKAMGKPLMKIGEILFYNFETNIHQGLTFEYDEVIEQCTNRLDNVGLRNLQAWEAYKQGKRNWGMTPYLYR